MIVCRGCGTENPEGESFCANCGSFLEFSGEKVEEPKPPPRARPAPPPRPVAPPPRPVASTPPPAPAAPPASSAPASPADPPRSNKGRITFSAPRPSHANSPVPSAPAPAAPSAPPTPAPPAAKAPPPPPATIAEGTPAPAAPAAAIAAEPATDPAVETAEEDAPATTAAEQQEMDARAKALITRPTATTPSVIRVGPQRPAATVPDGPGVGATQPRAPEARQPAAQQPAVPKAKVAPVRPPKAQAKQYRPGDLYCGKCGEGNEATRKFCRKCGESLAQAQVVAGPPWYKRIFKRQTKVMKAGERGKRYDGSPSGSRRGLLMTKKVFKILVVVVALLFLIAILGPWKDSFRAKQESVTRKIKGIFVPTYEVIHADGAEASSSLPDHPPALAIDGTTNLAWEEGANGDGVGEKLVLTFNQQVNIDRIGFHIGVSDDQEEFLSQPRPREIHVQFSNGKSYDLTLKDKPDFQHFSVKAPAVVRVEITVVTVNTSFKGGHDMGIAEVEVFKKT